jgi:hypothetical protein
VKTVAIELWESFLQGQSYKAYKYMHVKQFWNIIYIQLW